MDLLASHLIRNTKTKKPAKTLKRLSQSQAGGVKKKLTGISNPTKGDEIVGSSVTQKSSSKCSLGKKKRMKETLLSECSELESVPGKLVKLVSHPKLKQTLSTSSAQRKANLPLQIADGPKGMKALKQNKKHSLERSQAISTKKSKSSKTAVREQSPDVSRVLASAPSLKKKARTSHSKSKEESNGRISVGKMRRKKPLVLLKDGIKSSPGPFENPTHILRTNNSSTESVGTTKRKKESSKLIKTVQPSLKAKSVKSSTLDGNLTREDVFGCVKALQKLVMKDEQGKKTLFDSNKPPIFLQVNCIKVPKTPTHQLRIALPHSVVTPDDDIALFVKDLKRGRRRDYEDTVQFYEDLLQKHKCTRVKTIIPINQVKTEYRQFEMRRRLFKSYDHFLVDGRIAGHIAHLLGKHFRQKRKLPTSIHMDKKNLTKEIECAMKKTILQIHGNGDDSIVQIGAFTMKLEEIVDNILAALENLKVNFPGGWNNLRSVRIKTPSSLSIPIYVSLKNKNDVEVPVIAPKRPKAYQPVEGELSTFTSNVNVIVSPDGSVAVRKVRDSEPSAENATDEGGSIEIGEDESSESENSDE